MYEVKLQRTKSKKACVCLISAKNGKLVLKGEPINRIADALKVAHDLRDALKIPEMAVETLPWNYRWPKNAGPKKSKK